jgi:hypothetical protein
MSMVDAQDPTVDAPRAVGARSGECPPQALRGRRLAFAASGGDAADGRGTWTADVVRRLADLCRTSGAIVTAPGDSGAVSAGRPHAVLRLSLAAPAADGQGGYEFVLPLWGSGEAARLAHALARALGASRPRIRRDWGTAGEVGGASLGLIVRTLPDADPASRSENAQSLARVLWQGLACHFAQGASGLSADDQPPPPPGEPHGAYGSGGDGDPPPPADGEGDRAVAAHSTALPGSSLTPAAPGSAEGPLGPPAQSAGAADADGEGAQAVSAPNAAGDGRPVPLVPVPVVLAAKAGVAADPLARRWYSGPPAGPALPRSIRAPTPTPPPSPGAGPSRMSQATPSPQRRFPSTTAAGRAPGLPLLTRMYTGPMPRVGGVNPKGAQGAAPSPAAGLATRAATSADAALGAIATRQYVGTAHRR